MQTDTHASNMKYYSILFHSFIIKLKQQQKPSTLFIFFFFKKKNRFCSPLFAICLSYIIFEKSNEIILSFLCKTNKRCFIIAFAGILFIRFCFLECYLFATVFLLNNEIFVIFQVSASLFLLSKYKIAASISCHSYWYVRGLL